MNTINDWKEGNGQVGSQDYTDQWGDRLGAGAWRARFQVVGDVGMSATDSKAPVPPSAVLDRPNRLLVMAPRGDDVDRATALLTSAGLAHQDHLLNESDDTTAWLSQSEVGGLEQVQHWMQSHPGGHLLCLVPEPITEIATALSQGVAPAEALQAWSARVDEALAMIRALGRRRSSVLLADDLQAHPKALLKGLGERLQLTLVYRPSTGAAGMGGGLTDDAADEARIRRAGVQYEPRAIFRMMAENALWQAPSMRMRATELLALAVPVADGRLASLPAAEEVFAEYQQTLSESDEALRALTAQKNDARLKDLEEENDLLLQQLHHVQEELERHYLHQVNVSGSELAEAEAKIEALLNSKSWKITRPMRAVLGVLTGNKTDL